MLIPIIARLVKRYGPKPTLWQLSKGTLSALADLATTVTGNAIHDAVEVAKGAGKSAVTTTEHIMHDAAEATSHAVHNATEATSHAVHGAAEAATQAKKTVLGEYLIQCV